VQQQTLVAIETLAGPLARRGVHARIGDVVEPVAALLIEIGIISKRPPIDEIVAEIPHGTLDLALGLCPVRPTGARREAPVMREAKKLERRQLPGVTRIGRRVLFRSADLLDWLDQKRAPSPEE
jgi:hypothetical protein